MAADAALAAELERVRQFKAIPVPWHDGHQCLRDALAACLRIPAERVPPRADHQDLDAWDKLVAERFGVRLEYIPPDEPPPREPWIAIVPAGLSGDVTHAIAVIGNAYAARGRLAGYRIRPARPA